MLSRTSASTKNKHANTSWYAPLVDRMEAFQAIGPFLAIGAAAAITFVGVSFYEIREVGHDAGHPLLC